MLSKTLLVSLLAIGATALPAPQQPAATNQTTSSLSSSPPILDAPLAQEPGTAPTGADNTALLKELAVLPTAIDKFQRLLVGADGKLLQGDELKTQTVFDFNAAKTAKGAFGRNIAANVDSFPILKNLGLTTATFFMEACSVNTPHVHPRASEFLTVVDGEVEFGYILENGLLAAGKGTGEVTGTLSKFQGSVFPQGSIHYQANVQCDPATFIATLNDSDAGTNSVAQGFFGLNGDVVQASLGWPESFKGQDLEAFRSQIPASLAARVQECVQRCGLGGDYSSAKNDKEDDKISGKSN